MKNIIWIVLICTVLSGCVSTEKVITKPQVVILIPKKIAPPVTPTLKQYNTKYALEHPTNFRTFQENQLLLSDYILSLRDTVRYYETQIDTLEQRKTVDDTNSDVIQ